MTEEQVTKLYREFVEEARQVQGGLQVAVVKACQRIVRAEAERDALRAEVERLTAKNERVREECKELYTALHDMDNARLEVRRGLEALIVKTGNAYKPELPDGEP